jgi:hypothetical protein
LSFRYTHLDIKTGVGIEMKFSNSNSWLGDFYNSWLGDFYQGQEFLGGILSHFGVAFAPVYVAGDVGAPGFYNIPDVTPVTTMSVTYKAAGVPASDTYTGTTLWNLLGTAGGVETTSAKNDILSKYVIATGSDGYTSIYSLGEIDPQFGNQSIMVASSDTAGQLGPHRSDGLSRVVVPGDIAGGRYVSDLASLKVGSLPEPGSSGPGASLIRQRCQARLPTR